MTDKLSRYNGALRICGDRSLASLTENRESRRLLDAVWNDGAVRACLAKGNWQWATRTQQINYDSSYDPDFGYRYAFPYPSDCVRTVAISDDEYFSEGMTQFVDERKIWFADVDKIYVKFVSDDSSYGGDLSLWPESFNDLIDSYLAMNIISKLTGIVTSVESVKDTYKKALSEAQGLDGLNRPTTFPSRGNWNRARNGFYSNRDNRRRR